MKIVIAGGTGFLGKELIRYFNGNHELLVLVRTLPKSVIGTESYMKWDGMQVGEWKHELEGADVLINLSGKSVDCRYTFENKAEIYNSRLRSTTCLHKAILSLKNPPRVWLNAASATIYEHSLNYPNTEKDGIIGHGFSVDVCQRWEKAFFENELTQTRRVALRTAIVLGKDGALKPMLRLAKFGLGGKMGNGRQIFSWIHALDFCRAVEHIIRHDELSGLVNLSSPNPLSNKSVMKALHSRVKMPVALPSPQFLLNLGAKLIGTETELILKSRYVLPEKLLNSSFEFQFPEITDAFEDLIH